MDSNMSVKFSKSTLPKTFEGFLNEIKTELNLNDLHRYCLVYYEKEKPLTIDSSKRFEEFFKASKDNNNIQVILLDKETIQQHYQSKMKDSELSGLVKDRTDVETVDEAKRVIDNTINELINGIKEYMQDSMEYLQNRKDELVNDLRKAAFTEKGFESQIEKYSFDAVKDLMCDTLPSPKDVNIPLELKCSFCLEELDIAFKLPSEEYYLCQYCHLLLSKHFKTNFIIERHFEKPNHVVPVVQDYGYKAQLLTQANELCMTIKEKSKASQKFQVKILNIGTQDWTGDKVEFYMWKNHVKSYDIPISKTVPKNTELIMEIEISQLMENQKGRYDYKLVLYLMNKKMLFGDEIHIIIDII